MTFQVKRLCSVSSDIPTHMSTLAVSHLLDEDDVSAPALSPLSLVSVQRTKASHTFPHHSQSQNQKYLTGE